MLLALALLFSADDFQLLVQTGHSAPVRALAFSADEALVASGGDDKLVLVWDIASGKIVRRLSLHKDSVAALEFVPGGALLSTDKTGASVRWDVEQAEGVMTIGTEVPPQPVRVKSPSGKWEAYAKGAKIFLKDTKSGGEIAVEGVQPEIAETIFHPSKGLVLQRLKNGVRAWDLKNAKPLWLAPKSEMWFGDDGKLYVKQGDVVRARDPETFKLLDKPASPPPPKQRTQRAQLENGEILLDGKRVEKAFPNATAVVAGRTRLIVGMRDGTVSVHIMGKLVKEKSVKLHTADVTSLHLSPDERFIASGSRDGSEAAYDLTTGAPLWFIDDGENWLVHSAEGDFDASRGGGALAAIVRGLRGYEIDQFAARLNRPDRLLKVFGGDGDAAQLYQRLVERRAQKLGVDLTAPPKTPPTAEITAIKVTGALAQLSLQLKDDVALAHYTIFVSGVPALTKKIEALATQTLTVSVPLERGQNVIEVSATNSAGVESLRARRQVPLPPAQKRALYFLGFGVSRYADPALALDYAHKDALDLEAMWKRAPGFSTVSTKTFTDEAVTAQAIADAASFAQQAQPDDLFVLFVAGHGRHDERGYAYLAHDKAVDFAAFEALLEATPARNRLLLVDTCESGELDPIEVEDARAEGGGDVKARGLRKTTKTTPGNDKLRRLLEERERYVFADLQRRTGAIVFASSRGSERSFERADVQNGLFTAAFIDSLTGPSGTRALAELKQRVLERVQRESAGMQHPTIDRDNPLRTLVFPLIPR